MNDLYVVYCHTNKTNGKKYIGITKQDPPSKRWQNGDGYKRNKHFYSAIIKYGWYNFYHEILYTGLSKENAEKMEMYLISMYKTTNPDIGYNNSNGGNCKGTVSELTKQRMSKSRKGKKLSQEQIEKNRISHLGQQAWNKGISWSDEMKAKCNGKAVLCVETGKVYRTAHEAGRILNIDFSSICKCCNGQAKRVGGYHWQYVEVIT